MKKSLSLKFICIAFFTVFCLTLPSMPPAHAGKGKPNVIRVSKQHVSAGRGFASALPRSLYRRGHFTRHGFRNHRRGKSYAVRRDRHRYGRSYYGPYYYGYAYPYPYRTSYGYVPRYRSETKPVEQPYQPRPVTPKWVQVGDTDSPLGSYSAEAPSAESGARRNCLSVKTEIMVDGKPYDAFGEACIMADGTWKFRPSETND